MPRLLNWSTVIANPYQAPEVGCNIRLCGEVEDHPNFKDGDRIETSRVKSSIGRIVETRSGSVYSLEGPPDPDWMEYLQMIKYDLDVDDPIKQVSVKDSHFAKMGQEHKENTSDEKESR
jgi:hypothetical protein